MSNLNSKKIFSSIKFSSFEIIRQFKTSIKLLNAISINLIFSLLDHLEVPSEILFVTDNDALLI